MKDFHADVEPEEADDEYGADGGDDDYGDDYGEEGEGEEGEGGEDYGDYGDYGEEEDTWPPKESFAHTEFPDRFFNGKAGVRESYDNNEIDAFMRLLSIKPNKQWEDESTYHHKLGIHTYEDNSQELDPAFHTLSEEERKHAERITTKEWRAGTEVKF